MYPISIVHVHFISQAEVYAVPFSISIPGNIDYESYTNMYTVTFNILHTTPSLDTDTYPDLFKNASMINSAN